MCVYGGDNSKWFRQALESIYSQTLIPNEVVLIVDGPIPADTEAIIQEYQKVKMEFNVYRLERNMGHGNARREGLSHCKYEYIAIADSDDINTPTRFEKQIRCFENDSTLSAVSSWCYHFKDSMENILNEETIPENDEEIKEYMKRRCPLCQASTMFRKKDVERAGGYIDWYYAEDYYLWVRMYLKEAHFYNIPESLIYVRTDEAQSERRGGYKYYRSMEQLFAFMKKNKIIGFDRYILNIAPRFLIQVVMTPKMRAWVRKKLQ